MLTGARLLRTRASFFRRGTVQESPTVAQFRAIGREKCHFQAKINEITAKGHKLTEFGLSPNRPYTDRLPDLSAEALA